MIRQIKRYFAVSAYVHRLSQELARRFDIHQFYTIEQVPHTAQAAGFRTTFLAYAPAMFCSRPDFVSFYEPLHVRCSYDDLRRVVARRYFGGTKDFDASHIIRAMRQEAGSFYESHLGDPMA